MSCIILILLDLMDLLDLTRTSSPDSTRTMETSDCEDRMASISLQLKKEGSKSVCLSTSRVLSGWSFGGGGDMVWSGGYFKGVN